MAYPRAGVTNSSPTSDSRSVGGGRVKREGVGGNGVGVNGVGGKGRRGRRGKWG